MGLSSVYANRLLSGYVNLPIRETRVRVRYAETDQMGVVYHANYLVWMEVGRTDYGKSDGFFYTDLEKDGIVMAVVEASVRYGQAARYDDEVTIRTRVAEATQRTITFAYEMLCGDRKLATGTTKHLFCALSADKRELRPSRLPEKYRGYFGIR
ncbi:MAG: acyl-CoA thioesterase [Bryobacteraceae bacterium]|nr:acyl-CoA thioesterase [Bryobacteraceae bacterium]